MSTPLTIDWTPVLEGLITFITTFMNLFSAWAPYLANVLIFALMIKYTVGIVRDAISSILGVVRGMFA